MTELNNMTERITDCRIKNVVALYPLCDVAIDMMEGNKTTITETMLKAAGVVESLDGILKTATAIYDESERLQALRESVGLNGSEGRDTADLYQMAETEKAFRKNCDTWFMMFGRRAARTAKGAERPLYSLVTADVLTIGAERQAALTAAKGDKSKAYQKFAVRLMWATGRILEGKPLSTMSQEELEDIKQTEREKASERAEKAAKTRKKNEEKKAQERATRATEKAEYEKAKKEVEEARKNVVDRELLVAAINAMPLTLEQKMFLLDCTRAVKGSAEAAMAWTKLNAAMGKTEKPANVPTERKALESSNPIDCDFTEVA